MTDFIEWGALANIVVIGLALGAGLPALFAVAVRALAGPGAVDDAGHRPSARVAVAGLCLAIVVGAIAAAIAIISSGGH